MYKAKRAIIVAAGIGNRLRPLTLTTPKPLITVNGTRLIDSVIRSIRLNGITEIYVVVGYLKEQFKSLEDEYPGLTLIENPYFESCNNISSLYCAREHLSDVIITDADLLITDPSVLSPDFERSGYNAIWTDTLTDEWLMNTNEAGIVTGCSRTGGKRGWQLFSISRWNSEDGGRMKELLELEFLQKHNRDIYWDDIPMFLHTDSFTLGITPMDRDAVIEIDSLEELKSLDPSYL